MAIEFRCGQCNALLRTEDDTAGKQAQCPQCGAITTVPAGATDVGGPPPPPGASPFGLAAERPFPTDSGNPYQSPSPVATVGASAGRIAPGMLDMGDIFSRTWAIFKAQWGMCLAVILIVTAIQFAFNFVVSTGFNIAGMVADRATGGPGFAFFAFVITGNIVTALFAVWLQIGLAKYFLKVARGQRGEIGDIFTGGKHYLPILGAGILVGIVVVLGYVALIIPGVILSLMFSQYYYLIIDRNESIGDSLAKSRELMRGNKLILFAINLVANMLGLLLGIATCCVGFLAVGPYLALLHAVVYLTLTGQPTAERVRP